MSKMSNGDTEGKDIRVDQRKGRRLPQEQRPLLKGPPENTQNAYAGDDFHSSLNELVELPYPESVGQH